ncbi:hypothetical protein EMIHUDRAFT_119073 [Emiliania huxleyi CCMP1516]|uniref:Peptidase C14 caspase domain-containing protein n=2 Tax=Emiliania huxleyi TaxID=2903 RepID=A0A0D3IY92_EMIH1|nr:hypothetical protein EMIHUDRAFT_119073 [Emiliania huxleyi CCMP1516]EOD16227.1 hypothetical protein EMIHUDRAFT_119073 [Emiliania huxleyi CCMP1516]|eukprot:XP_005768656.1 hypothetical protein EMIHUDRAFT_119073 [Emiliania huxleyi CCMP1516]
MSLLGCVVAADLWRGLGPEVSAVLEVLEVQLHLPFAHTSLGFKCFGAKRFDFFLTRLTIGFSATGGHRSCGVGAFTAKLACRQAKKRPADNLEAAPKPAKVAKQAGKAKAPQPAAQKAAPAPSPTKKALVVGVAYPGKNRLKNPVNDAVDMAAALKRMGFTVTSLTHRVTIDKLKDGVHSFHDSLEQGDTALFFFAGHGCEWSGRNWLLPSSVPKEDRNLEHMAQRVDAVLDGMQQKKPFLSVLLLDCCRDIREMSRSATRSGAHVGLMEMKAPKGSIIGFACAPDKTADDGTGRNGVWTSHLLKHIEEPKLDVRDLLVRVAKGVEKDTKDTQSPWNTDSLRLETTENASLY